MQSGKTEWDIVDAFALISFGASYQLVQPKDDLAAVFTRTRIQEPVKRSPYYHRYLASMNMNRLWKWSCPTNETGMLRIVFSTREDEMISFPADIIGVDEVDKCDLNNLALLPDRLLGSDYGLERRTSTPTTVGNDNCRNIWWHYCQTDRMEYYLPCGHCGTWQPLTWHDNIIQERRDAKNGQLLGYELRDTEWSADQARDIFPICRACGLPLERLAHGEWKPTEGVPKTVRKRGYHWNKLTSPLVPIRKSYDDYTKAVNNPTELQRFFNSVLGLPFVGAGTQITEAMLQRCVADYLIPEFEQVSCELPCSLGIDQGPKYFDVRVSCYPDTNSRVRKAVFIGKLRTVEELHALVAKCNVRVAVWDIEPETRLALEFQRTAKCQTFVTYMREKKMTLQDLFLEKVKAEKKVTLDRTTLMDSVLATYANSEQILPRNLAFLSNGEYVYEMTNPTRVLEVDDKGNEKFVWTSGADHAFLADVYDYCAMLLGYFGMHSMGLLASPRPMVCTLDSRPDYDLMADMA